MSAQAKVAMALVAFAFAAVGLACIPLGDDGEGCCHYEQRTTGGPQTSLKAKITLDYNGAVIAHGETDIVTHGSDATRLVEIAGDLPRSWSAPDVADAGDDAATAADSGVDAGGGALGLPRGWGTRGRVAVIDVGIIPAGGNGALERARVVTCQNPYEKLVGNDGGYECESGVRRPARVVTLTGTYESTSGSSTTIRVVGTTESGAEVELTWLTYTTPYSTMPVCTSASVTC